MSRYSIILISALLVSQTPALLAAGMNHANHEGMAGMTHEMAGKTAMSHGIVKKVDAASGKVTISHGPLLNLDMPAMTMAFRVKNAQWLNQLKAGDSIDFVAESVNGVLTMTRYSLSK